MIKRLSRDWRYFLCFALAISTYLLSAWLVDGNINDAPFWGMQAAFVWIFVGWLWQTRTNRTQQSTNS